MQFFEELKWRGLIKDVTDEVGFVERLKQPLVLYCGFDPTADSLHIGSLQQLLLLKRYQQHGHTPIALLGEATGMIGDPRPTSERRLLSLEEIRLNSQKIRVQLDKFLSNEGPNALLSLNNYDWLSKIDLLSFLRDYGKYFNVNTMINKETIQSRLESGISYTEFTYTILQAIDFMHLYQHHQCELQIGGSDQWGNLVSGTDLIRKTIENAKVFGVTSPLITNSDGSKFGKSEGQNIWLDPEKTSPYQFYQYWLNVSDADILDFMKRLSMHDRATIEAFAQRVATEPHLRAAQKALAEELTELVHGHDALVQAQKVSQVFFTQSWDMLSAEELELALNDAPSVHVTIDSALIDALLEGGLVKSKREARDLISAGSVNVNGRSVLDIDTRLSAQEALYGSLYVVRKGKKSYLVVRLGG
jgi:tyrosyl-tRNA synthetase